ncbi:hypothetical protein Q4Q35_04960 [Flavivirga aquimarina]|uniref:DUF1330 domain-containing protein n=1 Tax=Flavivirga aquimarina TaxID=2027862 RepID=A0ABT8W7Q1_9FLAO|nr:hypothetical protein [Flavivirga aquimarina]MDO5969152.1 hypothetical protein [Flavivirga aquimarina]
MIYLTALMFVKEGKEEVFNEYESFVLPLLNNYSGKLIYRIRPNEKSYITAAEETPYEIHFISFKTNEDFIRFVNDEKRKSFENLKEEAIKSSFIVKGEKL